MKDEKLQKALARLGLGSRRQMEDVIREGRVSVNGQVATIGDRVGQGDEIRVDGRQLRYTAENEKTSPCTHVLQTRRRNLLIKTTPKVAQPCLNACHPCRMTAGLWSDVWISTQLAYFCLPMMANWHTA